MTPHRRIVVALPAYRAERTLSKTVAAIPEGAADHLILVDDASPDATAEIARGLGIDVVVHPTNRGYGGNQKTCYVEALAANADIVVLLHPDYQYDPAAVPLLTAPILAGDADMTFGSRFAGLGDPLGGGMPVYRYLGNRISTTVENLILGSRFTEMHSGMRAYTRQCLLSLPFLGYSDDFAFDSQFLIDAVTLGLRVVEVPIPTRYTEESSSIGVGRSFRYVAASVLYCARRTIARGRRGRRSPVVGAAQAKPASATLGLAAVKLSPALARWVVDTIAAYPVTTHRFKTSGAGTDPVTTEIASRGWIPAQPPVELQVLGAGPQSVDATSLATIRKEIASEGLLAVVAPTGTAGIDADLRAAGFRIVGSDSAPRAVGRCELVIARPM